MKKALLFLTFTAITVSSFAQSAIEKLALKTPVKVTIAPSTELSVLKGAKTSTIILVDTSIAAVIKDTTQFTPDSLYRYFYGSAPYNNGYFFGTNALLADTITTLGAAESYPFTHVADKNDTAWNVLGVAGIWLGTVNSSSTNSLTYKIWSIDTNIVKNPTAGKWDLIGIPGSVLASVNVSFINLHVGTGNLGVGWFATPITNLETGIYAGYEISTPWATTAAAGDTIALGATSQRAIGTTDKDYYFVTASNDSVIITRGAYEINSTWYDYAYDLGLNGYLSIAPIVQVTANPTSVKGIQNNNLTFFGNYPNPATTSTNIKFSLKNSADVTVYVSDMTGRLLKTVNQPGLSSGDHIVTLNTSDLAAGNYVYMVRTSQGGAMASKLTVVK